MTRSEWISAYENRLIDFAVSVIEYCDKLPQSYAFETLSKQLIRSSTSVVLNYGEARGSVSSKEFIHKMGTCLKELNETKLGLEMINKLNVSGESPQTILLETGELIAITISSIQKAKSTL